MRCGLCVKEGNNKNYGISNLQGRHYGYVEGVSGIPKIRYMCAKHYLETGKIPIDQTSK